MSNTPDSSSFLFTCLPALQAICNVSEQRGKELLEATNGSLERAVDLHLHQARDEKQGLNPTRSHGAPPSANESDTDESKKRVIARVSSTDSPKKRLKDGQIHSFFKSNRHKPSPTVPSSIKAIGDVCNSGGMSSIKCSTQKSSIAPTKTKSKESHHPVEASLEMSFENLANTLQKASDTTKRTLKLKALKDFISGYVHESDERRAAFRLTGALSIVLGNPVEESLGVSGRTVSSALQDSLGVSSRQLSKGYRQYGDLGDSAASFFQSKKYFVSHNPLQSVSVVEVLNALRKVTVAEGKNAKKSIVSKLLRLCQSRNEVRFMVRLLIGNMRIGCNMKTVLAAIAMAFQSHSKEKDFTAKEKDFTEKAAIQLVQKTHDICPNLEKILRALLLGGFEKMENDCKMQLFTPIAPMLATPTHSIAEIDQAMTKLQKSAILEWKYDGVRCQAHFGDGNAAKCSLYSRHLLETTAQYPDAVRGILDARNKSKEVHSFIIDAEIVAVEGTRLLPFQDLATRKKKDDGTGVKIKVFCFDLMYLDGKSCVALPLWKRRDLLREHFNETHDFAFVSSKILQTFDEHAVTDYLGESMRQGTEGLMVKMLGGDYEAGTRSQSWLKVKGDYVEGFADTIDVVPIGAWHGTGRKAEKGFLSPILLAVYDEDEDVYRSICRCMTFTDTMYTAMRNFYQHGIPYPSDLSPIENETNKKIGTQDSEDEGLQDPSFAAVADSKDSSEEELLDDVSSNCFANRPTSAFIVTNEQPPLWFKPVEVWEISFADMSLSRQHTAGAGFVPDPDGRGIALRFPRFKRRRPDKAPWSATTSAQIAAMFLNQAKQMKSSAR
ncbi:unnamed protein product [Cylindrotheca closterium]|uniref:DNA ligase n=1 Tax=Cylindrotheca closterium TaxID=2856 RepID=A0AAD2FZ10_9STRA|nr:unnamed protein product [Cylindrotheca closterium]